MAKWLEHVDIEEDFFQLNPQFRYIEPFSELYNQKAGSKLMWSVFLFVDPHKSNKFHRMDKEEKLRNIALYCSEFDVDDMTKYVEAYKKDMLTMEERLLLNWEDNLKKIDSYISKQIDTLDSLDVDEALKVQRMLKESKPAWDTFKQVKDDFSASQEEGRVTRKNAKESASERGEL